MARLILGLALAAACTAIPFGLANAASSSSSSSVDTKAVLKKAHWSGHNVKVSFDNGQMRWRSNGLPNAGKLKQYVIPNFGVIVPNETNSHIESSSDSIKSQEYDIRITTKPRLTNERKAIPAGPVGVSIGGPLVYNPYEGDGKTVALASNFTLTNSQGNKVPFADKCNGHPNPFGQYHYHGLPRCVTAQVDKDNGPSHIIGVAFDGFPIYGDRDVKGNKVKTSKLDSCNGIKSATPEYPKGIYHYVLLDVPTKQSSPACLRGEVNVDLLPKIREHRSHMLCTFAPGTRPRILP